MLVFAASDKGGTGRSVTSANLAYQRALAGDDVCYLDFDFGSPTAAAVFDVPERAGRHRARRSALLPRGQGHRTGPDRRMGRHRAPRCCATGPPAPAGWS